MLFAGLLTLLLLAALSAFRAASRTVTPPTGTTSSASAVTSSALSQNGFTLLAVQHGQSAGAELTVKTPLGPAILVNDNSGGVYEAASDATVLWIQPPLLPHASPAFLRNEFRVTVRASTGTTFRMPYSLADGGTPPFLMPQTLCVALPDGYPNTYRYFDVTVTDRNGHRATWRLTDLPRMKHFLAHPQLQTQETQSGFTVQAAAWQDDDLAPGYGHAVMTGLHVVSVPATMAHQWELEASNPVMEWTADAPSAGSGTLSSPIPPNAPRDGWMTPFWQTPYAHDIHYAGQEAALCQFETYDEPVTFHDVTIRTQSDYGGLTYCVVSAAQSVTTPSGVTITLPRQHMDQNASQGGDVNAINCDFVLSGGDKPQLLPQSPLCRQFNRPATLQIVMPKPADVNMWGTNNGTLTLGFTLPKPYPTHLADFTVIVRQRVNLQSFPLHFVVPVGANFASATAGRHPTS